ncbi:hypothetical protein M5X11_12895 [Paenibacillus alginolyticus]|uniref:hypothetical protein n=1 Tax=Paenibacillus alginolyticus TaxID=59839 RepID=UPI0006872376|nr:hypothetical protein [Paenibacillus alginolyticus]MCY9665852.1 hypothetical protein [Paenibacillus alginolyticus]
MSINPIFTEPAPVKPVKAIFTEPTLVKPVTPILANPNVKLDPPVEIPAPTSQKKSRSDKKQDIRICVTPNQKALIRLMAKELKSTPTKYATNMLLAALSNCASLPEYQYSNTKLFVHVKLKQQDYQKLFELAVVHDVSEREAATRLVMHILCQRSGAM